MPGSTRVTRPFTTLPTMLDSPRRSTRSSASEPFSRIATRVSPRDALIRISFCMGPGPGAGEPVAGASAGSVLGGPESWRGARRASGDRLSGFRTGEETLSIVADGVDPDSGDAVRRRSTRTGIARSILVSGRFSSGFFTTVSPSRRVSGSSTPPAHPLPQSSASGWSPAPSCARPRLGTVDKLEANHPASTRRAQGKIPATTPIPRGIARSPPRLAGLLG